MGKSRHRPPRKDHHPVCGAAHHRCHHPGMVGGDADYISPECDCWNHNDAAIIPDLGMLASADPVALDKACADLVIQAPVLHSDNVLAKKHEHEDLCGCDKFHMIHPDTDWLAGLRHAEKIGLGTMDYELIKI